MSKSFLNTKNFPDQADTFFKNLKSKIHKCFKKVRITSGRPKSYGDKDIQENLKQLSELKQFLRTDPDKIAAKEAE